MKINIRDFQHMKTGALHGMFEALAAELTKHTNTDVVYVCGVTPTNPLGEIGEFRFKAKDVGEWKWTNIPQHLPTPGIMLPPASSGKTTIGQKKETKSEILKDLKPVAPVENTSPAISPPMNYNLTKAEQEKYALPAIHKEQLDKIIDDAMMEDQLAKMKASLDAAAFNALIKDEALYTAAYNALIKDETPKKQAEPKPAELKPKKTPTDCELLK